MNEFVERSLERKAYESLRQMIFEGVLRPNQRIIQEDIAKRIGISRTPLRRVLPNLERDHLVHATPQGFVVATFDDEFMTSMWELRAVLEGLACRLLAPMIDLADIEYFRTKFRVGYERAMTGDITCYRDADLDFHTRLAALTKNNILIAQLKGSSAMEIARRLPPIRPTEVTMRQHNAILDALEAKDSDLAERRMVEHIRGGMRKKDDQPRQRGFETDWGEPRALEVRGQ